MYPQDFAAEVYCPASIMAELAALLPYGADALGIAGEYFYIACLRGTADLSRGGASFPLYYLHDGERHAATVRLKKRAVSNSRGLSTPSKSIGNRPAGAACRQSHSALPRARRVAASTTVAARTIECLPSRCRAYFGRSNECRATFGH